VPLKGHRQRLTSFAVRGIAWMNNRTERDSSINYYTIYRSQSDVKPTLAPSYRILFENIDRTVDLSGYPNRKALHLKCLAISGLPVDEIPCVEVFTVLPLQHDEFDQQFCTGLGYEWYCLQLSHWLEEYE
jgi:hypothetical protein